MKIDGKDYRTIWFEDGGKAIKIIDQNLLPYRFAVLRLGTLAEVAHAIKNMNLRGAPLIGAAAACGIALAMHEENDDATLASAASLLGTSRPTAVNLHWAVERMLRVLRPLPPARRTEVAMTEAAAICDEDVIINRAIGQQGLKLLQQLYADRQRPLNLLTHCNAGWLATVDWGTALAPVYAAFDAGIPLHVWVDETRPRNQGAALTAWELGKHGVPHTVITDNAGGHLMQHGKVDIVIVGADRVTSRGDVCNKIGTYLKALAANDNGIPFYAAVPSPTLDLQITDGLREIPIEVRSPKEVAFIQGQLPNGEIVHVNLLPEGSAAANPAFDVTPARLVTGIITEHGVIPPDRLRSLFP